ncbi:hypothetical protein RUM44_007392 [Polyplax serrata]|uniref:Fibronectin type-III domain-containing protein n=1 Tax=Polyplax serrata TaxID=468196 RepID=A0ABR1B0J2_POLSC
MGGQRYPSSFQENETSNQLGRGDWSDVILPAIPSELFTQQMSYVIRGLEPGSQYEARVRARNRFGWNELSEQFHFSTRGSELDIRDLSMTASYNSAARFSFSSTWLSLISLILIYR